MTDSPHCPNSRRFHHRSFAAHDRRDRDDVIWIGRVPHAEHQAGDESEKQTHC